MTDDILSPVPWETRNLGRESFQVSEAWLDSPNQAALEAALRALVASRGAIFVQARAAQSQLGSVPFLEAAGFRFIETVLEPHTVLGKNEVLSRFRQNREPFMPPRSRVIDWSLVTLAKDDDSQTERVRTIASESFTKDRFHVDPACAEDIADRRFVLWVDDLLSSESVRFDLAVHQGSIEGFMARRGESLILAGFSRRFTGMGVGDFLWLAILERMLEEGSVRAHTLISVNNVSVLNLYVRLAFKFRNPAATLHLWLG